ncbi:MAG TPA: metallophosphoesterase [Phycisphaerae bacterium]|nr:metallophosphoesterase [Phycisphaerae bacterium]
MRRKKNKNQKRLLKRISKRSEPLTLDNTSPVLTKEPHFAEPAPTPDPTKFIVKHGSDKKAYSILDSEKSTLKPRPFPVLEGTNEPVLDFADTLGDAGPDVVQQIQKAGQIVFHSVGDTGNTRGPKDEDLVSDKMVADFDDTDPKGVPSFLYHLGDVVYSFGEYQYYYDQFYDPYRDYPAPIFAIPGNHDGMVSPFSSTPSLQAFMENFCTDGQPLHKTPEAGELVRTAQIQPSVYFTFEAPFVRILGLYSNCLEDPGVISDQKGTYPSLSNAQLIFLKTALERVKSDEFNGALIIAVHHPPYVAQTKSTRGDNAGRHGGSPIMLEEIDAVCEATGVWPHALLSGHAHNYQRFTRSKDERQTPFIVCGNGGHHITHLTGKGEPTLRTPMPQTSLSDGTDSVTFENYDDDDFGYLRIIVDTKQLRIEYHPASDGADAKTPDDFVTVDLSTHTLVHYNPIE